MTCGTADNSGERLRSLLILCTGVSDATGSADDVPAAETIFSLGDSRLISANGAPSRFRRFRARGSDGGTDDGADGKFLGLQVWSLADCAALAGVDVVFLALARGEMILGKKRQVIMVTAAHVASTQEVARLQIACPCDSVVSPSTVVVVVVEWPRY